MSSIRRREAPRRGATFIAGLLAVWILVQPAVSWASQPKEYAYLVVRGRITDRSQGRPVAGAVIRLETGSRVFEATTDDGGVFIFKRLPVASYEMRVTSGSGEVLRSIQEVDTDVPDLKRLRIRFGRGKERAAVIEAREEGVTVIAPQPPVRWKRFWTQFAIFAGSAALLAL